MEFYGNPHRTYKSEKGRKFRVSAIEKVSETSKWINRMECSHWKILIIFIDNQKPKRLKLTYDYNQKIIEKEEV